jgi:hypothetical protein
MFSLARYLDLSDGNPLTVTRFYILAGRALVSGKGAVGGRPFISGGLNRSTQHFILEGKDGVWDGTKIS